MAATILPKFDFASLASLYAYEFQPPNPLLLESDLNDLFQFIWARDAHNCHPRYRIQVAFAILLFFHLGLHPRDGLSEGLYYADTQVLLQRHNGSLRALLLIRLEGRKNRLAKLWCGRTMILADNPAKRYACPVTMFLSMAIADRVFDGINNTHDLATLTLHNWPHWTILPYRGDLAQLPVLRRTVHNWRLITTSAMKKSVLHGMMDAQMERAGHKHTLATMLSDKKGALQCERRYGSKALMVGRDQGEIVLPLLAATPVVLSTMTLGKAAATSVFQSPLPVSEAVQIQLRYDHPRSMIISHLFGVYSSLNEYPGILWPFIEGASPLAHEAYYSDTTPDVFGNCAVCGGQFAQHMRTHLLKCCQRKKDLEATHELKTSDPSWRCRWGSCSFHCHTSMAADHMRVHLKGNRLRCQWKSCMFRGDNIMALHNHLGNDHNVFTHLTLPTQAQFCVECNIWTSSILSWIRHKEFHVKNPSIIYGPVMVGDLVAAPRRCPYCIQKGQYVTHEGHIHYIKHLETHIDAHVSIYGESRLQCPHFSCAKVEYGKRELWSHLREVHGITETRDFRNRKINAKLGF